MVTSSSRLSYSDCFSLMDRAIADDKGIKIKFAQQEDAWHFRIRLHTARKIDRLDNKVTYPENHAMHGRSVYDALTMRIRQEKDHAWLRLERIDAREFEVESLSEAETEPELAFAEPPVAEMALIKPTITHETRKEIHEVQPLRRLRRI